MSGLPANGETVARDRLFQRFAQLGIDAPTVPYPAHRTVEEGKILRGPMAGTFTKHLLQRAKQDRLLLVSIHEDRGLDLTTPHTRLGATGRMGLDPSDRMIAGDGETGKE